MSNINRTVRRPPTHEIKTRSPLQSPARAPKSHPMLTRKGGRSNRGGRYRSNVPRSRNPTRGGSLRHSVNNASVSDVAWLAQKSWQAIKTISSLINVEEKLFDMSGTGNVSTSGSVINLSNIAEGSDFSNRDGNSILTQRLDISIIFTNNSSSNSTFIRFIVVRDNDQRGTDPAPSDILESGTLVVSPVVHYTEKRFSILHDSLHSMSIGGENCGQLRIGLNLNKHIYYSNTTGADSSNYEGALYLFAVSDQATNTPAWTFYSRLAFTDN